MTVNEHTNRPALVPERASIGIVGMTFRAVLTATTNPYLADRLPLTGYVSIHETDIFGGVQPNGVTFMPDAPEGEHTSFVAVPDARFEFGTRPVERG